MSAQPTNETHANVDLKVEQNKEIANVAAKDVQEKVDLVKNVSEMTLVVKEPIKTASNGASGVVSEGKANEASDVPKSTKVDRSVPGKVIKNFLSSSLANLLIYSSDDSEDECDDDEADAAAEETIEDIVASVEDNDDSDSDSDTPHIEPAYSSSDSDSDELSFAGTKKKNVPKDVPPATYTDLDGKNLPPVPDLSTLTFDIQEQDCVHMGTILNIVDNLVMVEALPDIPAYDLDTLLFLDKGKRPLGFVFDVIGQVSCPMYAVRFNSKAEIDSQDIKRGSAVYSAPKSKYTQYVFLQQLMQVKGSDASWTNDVEMPVEFVEFSDDEAEYQRVKAAKRSEMKRKRNSLERHQKFECEMNQRNIAETSRHVPRREAPSYSLFGYVKNNNGGNAFNHSFNADTTTAPPPNPVYYGVQYYTPPVYAVAQPRFMPVPHPVTRVNSSNVLPFNCMMYDMAMCPPPIGNGCDMNASPFPYLFTPPPPPPSEEPKQDVPPAQQCPVPYPHSTNTSHQQNMKWPDELP